MARAGITFLIFPPSARRAGGLGVAHRLAVLQLPGVIVPTEWTYLRNGAHPDFTGITIGPKQPIKFDPRLIKVPTP